MKSMKLLRSSGICTVVLSLFIFLIALAPQVSAAEEGDAGGDDPFEDEMLFDEEDNGGIADPLEPVNRVFFQFNDKLYFWALKPVATGYERTVAEDIRVSVRDFFYNLLSPIRIVNNLLQGKVKESGTETARFLINTTIGVAGFGDPAKHQFGLETSEEDFGQTLGKYGVGEGFYIVWPIFGPSNVRDTVGMAGDYFLSPLSYVSLATTIGSGAAKTTERINDVSLRLGDYEQFKESSFDPYLALRDAYRQYRNNEINDDVEKSGKPAYSKLQEQSPAAKSLNKAADLKRSVPGHHAGAVLGNDKYFIHVGTFAELTQAHRLQKRLTFLNRDSIITVHEKGDFLFYGVQVPAGNDLATAKLEEEYLVGNGFSETVVVR